jgi:hypothetical protein
VDKMERLEAEVHYLKEALHEAYWNGNDDLDISDGWRLAYGHDGTPILYRMQKHAQTEEIIGATFDEVMSKWVDWCISNEPQDGTNTDE